MKRRPSQEPFLVTKLFLEEQSRPHHFRKEGEGEGHTSRREINRGTEADRDRQRQRRDRHVGRQRGGREREGDTGRDKERHRDKAREDQSRTWSGNRFKTISRWLNKAEDK